MLKRVLKVLGIFSVLLIISGILLINTVNTETNKRTIQKAILTATGYELTIAGDIDVNFFPSIGLTLNDVRLKNPGTPQELASTTAAILSVDVRALFSGNLLVQELSTNDFHINYFVDAEGQNIWDVDHELETFSSADSVITNATTTSLEFSDSEPNSDIVAVSFERIQISNASIDIQDVSQGTRYSIKNLNLDSRDTNIEGKPFALDLTFDFLNYDPVAGEALPTAIGLQSNVVADINQQIISLSDVNLSLTPMLLQGDFALSNLNSTMTYQGEMDSNNFSVIGLLQTLGLIEENKEFTGAIGGSTDSPPPLAFEFSFSGDQEKFSIPDLTASLGSTEVEADMTVRFATDFSPTNISYDLKTNSLDLTPFLTKDDVEFESDQDVEEAEDKQLIATETSAQTSETELPLELLNALNLLGSISVESITTNEFNFTDINIFTNIENGVLDIEIQPIRAFDGNIEGTIRLDGSGKELGRLSTQFVVSELDIISLAPSISRFESVTGRLGALIDLQAQGLTTNDLMNSLNGSTRFIVDESNVNMGLIKQVFTAIAALSPREFSVDRWPDIIQYNGLNGHIKFENGISEGQQVNLRMDNIDISGSGGIDIDAETIDYELTFTVLGGNHSQTISIDTLYHNVPWPVRCNAAFSDPISQYCRPNFEAVRDVFSQLGRSAFRGFLEDSLTEQLPNNLQEVGRGILRSLLN
jgi:AsmA protein